MVISDNASGYCIVNGEIKAVDELKLLNSDKMVYEVVRVISSVPLFLEDHFKRLENSLNLIGTECSCDIKTIRECITKLTFVEQANNFNVKLIISVLDSIQTLVVYTSKSYYPTNEEYSKGVLVNLLNLERETPNIKKINYNYTNTIREKISETKAFELLLVNSSNQILEGSKSNVFFVQDKKVLTAPNNLVLVGITRCFVVDICHRMGFELSETCLTVNDLSSIDAVFLTGTSIKVLPVKSVDNYYYESSTNSIVNSIQHEYDNIINQYIQDNCIK